jgi:hypothetical protein
MNDVPAAGPALVRRRRLQLVAIALVFAGPLALAFWLYYGGGALLPHARVNRGVLVDPVRPLPAAVLPTPAGAPTAADFLRGKWSLSRSWAAAATRAAASASSSSRRSA